MPICRVTGENVTPGRGMGAGMGAGMGPGRGRGRGPRRGLLRAALDAGATVTIKKGKKKKPKSLAGPSTVGFN
jgi:hypothetical protein